MNGRSKESDSHDVCTWRPASACEGCALSGRLKCRFTWAELLRFGGTFMYLAVPAVIGLILSGYGLFLLGWLAFMLFFFGVWESRILCAHCPFYAERDRTLHCIANYGFPKFWRYHPEPMNAEEKAQLLVGFAVLGGYPLPFLILGRQWIFVALTILGGLMFFRTLLQFTCTRCVNFSCPLNRVPKPIVDAYLMRNPVMREAWEAKGWTMSPVEDGKN
jgi:hypothetical protein